MPVYAHMSACVLKLINCANLNSFCQGLVAECWYFKCILNVMYPKNALHVKMK